LDSSVINGSNVIPGGYQGVRATYQRVNFGWFDNRNGYYVEQSLCTVSGQCLMKAFVGENQNKLMVYANSPTLGLTVWIVSGNGAVPRAAAQALVQSHSSEAPATCEAQWDNQACTSWGECYTCGARISYLVDTIGLSRAGAGQQVSDSFEEACGACGGSCFGEFAQVVSEQGGGVGGEIIATSDEACKVACRGDPNCKSFVYCPGWGNCWMKDRQLNGSETTGPQSDCRTYYQTEFCS